MRASLKLQRTEVAPVPAVTDTPTISVPSTLAPTSKIPKALLQGAFPTGVPYSLRAPLGCPRSRARGGGGPVPWQTSSGTLPVLTMPCRAPAAAVTH